MDSKNKWTIASALIILISISIIYAGWQIHENTGFQTRNQDTLFQLAAFNKFATGEYTGFMTYYNLEQHGDFGIGTFDEFDGEMLAFDGVFYQIPSNGIPREVEPSQTAPYATITYFKTDETFKVSNLNYTSLRVFLDEHLSEDAIYAIKVHGDYNTIQCRSPQKQTEPYPNLNDAISTQAIFNLTDTSATAVGFYFPTYMEGVDYTGYHLHILTDNHTAGGHLLDCQITNATVEIEKINSYNLILP